MDKHCTQREMNQCITYCLDELANISEKQLVSISAIAPNKTISCTNCLLSALSIVNGFGVIEFQNLNEQTHVKTISKRARFFIRSFSEYLKNELPLFINWDEEKGRIPDINDSNIFFGTQFLFLMEKRRIGLLDSPKPINTGEVVRVLIKSKDKKGNDIFLCQFDQKTHQYKLIGGLKNSTDKDTLYAIQREINEELPHSHMVHGSTYILTKVLETQEQIQSFVYGAYSDYKITIFHANILDGTCLKLGKNDRWITLNEMQNNITYDHIEIFESSRSLIETMKRVSSSIVISKKGGFISLINKNAVIIGLTITFLSLIVGVIKIFL